jgi:hypothetical protein
MPTNLFSTYSTGENRVTASILAVLRSLSLDRMQRLIGALLEQSEFELVEFQNQPSKGGKGVPDAEIYSSCRLLLETKIKRGMVFEDQLQRHLERLNESQESIRRLLVLTPDDNCPSVVDNISDDRLVWASFSSLDQAIDELLDDPREVVSEREAFLLRELQTMFAREDLVGNANDVVVVPARGAWPEYKRHSAYICQPDRSFQNVSRIAFYTDGKICTHVPLILESHEHVEWGKGLHDGRLGKLVDTVCDDTLNQRKDGLAYKVMILSAPNSPETVQLDEPVVNDLVSKNGRTTAFTQNQRYVSLDLLKQAKKTSDVV